MTGMFLLAETIYVDAEGAHQRYRGADGDKYSLLNHMKLPGGWRRQFIQVDEPKISGFGENFAKELHALPGFYDRPYTLIKFHSQ
jgi:hypothetical protein